MDAHGWDGPRDRMAPEPLYCPDNMVEPWIFGDGCGTPTQLTLPAGTFCILHPDTWHRATVSQPGNDPSVQRFMLRFHFQRTVEPTTPSWHHTDRRWVLPRDPGLPDLLPVWLASFRWMLGAMAEPLPEETRPGNSPQPAVLVAVQSHLTASETDSELTPDVIDKLSWCDWERITDEVWCCHVNWECTHFNILASTSL